MPSAIPERGPAPARHTGHALAGRTRAVLLPLLMVLLTGPTHANGLLVRFREDPAAAGSRSASQLAGLPAGLLTADTPLHRSSHEASLGWHLLESGRPDQLELALRALDSVERIWPNRRLALCQDPVTPDDSLRSEQWALDWLGAESAWRITEGDPGLIVAVIDTGVDPWHPDLREQWAINAGEDLDGDGVIQPDGQGGWRLDPDDLDGLDTDGNGFVDDLLGWDFTDSPEFPAPGDHREQDNQPWDEHGHGTAVSGIIGAARQNGLGIAGLAPGCRMLPLRAANSLGWLEEDDVAAAILYAIDRGARVLNLSFGDTAASPLLEDLLEYARSRGVVAVASSGNTGDASPHWPSGFPSTIAVGSALLLQGPPRLVRAGSSSYGPGLDLLAPGVNILTTALGGGWQSFSGTSASAPWVSAACALLLSLEPDLSPAGVKDRLLLSARDIGAEGWDEESAAGVLDPPVLLSLGGAPRVAILSPANGTQLPSASLLEQGIVLSAWGSLFSHAELRLGDSWASGLSLAASDTPWVADTLHSAILAQLDPQSSHSLWLELESLNGNRVLAHSRFALDDTAPVILEQSWRSVRQAGQQPFLLELACDERASLTAELEPGGIRRTRFLAGEHRLLLDGPAGGTARITLELVNEAGLVTRTEPVSLTWPTEDPPAVRADESFDLPAGVWLGQAGDWDGDGTPETLLAPWSQNRLVPDVCRVYAISPDGTVTPDARDFGHLLPKGVGDSDGDGNSEFLLGISGRAQLWEARQGGLPDSLVWQDGQHWAGGLIQIPALSPRDLLLLQTADDLRRNSLWSCVEDPAGDRAPTPHWLLDLPSPWEGQPSAQGPPGGCLADTDGDGQSELFLADRSGHLFSHAFTGGTSRLDSQLDFPGWTGPGAWLCAVPQGAAQGVALLLHSPAPSQESEAGGQVWRLLLLGRPEPAGDLLPLDSLDFVGVADGEGFANALALWHPENGEAELALLLTPLAYSVSLSEGGRRLGALRQLGAGVNGASLLVLDRDGDGQEELLLPADGAASAGSRLWRADEPDDPRPPLWDSRSRPLARDRILLAWSHSGVVPDSVLVLAGEPANTVLARLAGEGLEWQDSSLVAGERRSYRLRSLRAGQSSALSPSLELQGANPPELEQWEHSGDTGLTLRFSAALRRAGLESAIQLRDPAGQPRRPASMLLSGQGRLLRLELPAVSQPEDWTLELQGLVGTSGAWMDSLVLGLAREPQALPAPVIQRAEVLPGNRVRLEFSRAMDSQGLALAESYRFEPLREQIAAPAVESERAVVLSLDPSRPLRAGSPRLLLISQGLRAADGTPLVGDGARVLIQAAVEGLAEFRVYPNPWRVSGPGAEGGSGLVFAGLPRGSTIRLHAMDGQLLETLEEHEGSGAVRWLGQDHQGNALPSGVYLYSVVAPDGSRVQGRLALIR
ncbi:MAG: S8 family serine peptidase [Candidatus Delongbacteria bacterium]|nr:S8 family serine peptidase [Candidatus Delongbacteria bacterium]